MSETEPGPKCRSDAQIEWMSGHYRPGFMGKFRRSIRRTVIHDENVNLERTSRGELGPDRGDHGSNGLLLIERRNYGKHT